MSHRLRYDGVASYVRMLALVGGLWGIAAQSGCVTIPVAPRVTTAGEPRLDALPCDFSLVTWNTFKRPAARVSAELAAMERRAELVLLQEVTFATRPDATPNAWAFAIAFSRRRDARPAGVATASDATVHQAVALWAPDREPLLRTPKVALATRHRLEDGRELIVVNLHGVNFRRAQALARQLESIRRLVADHSGPMIVAGDFNTWSRRRRRAMQVFALELGLVTADDVLDRRTLDHVLVRDLVVRSFGVVETRASDHDMVVVELGCNGVLHHW